MNIGYSLKASNIIKLKNFQCIITQFSRKALYHQRRSGESIKMLQKLGKTTLRPLLERLKLHKNNVKKSYST